MMKKYQKFKDLVCLSLLLCYSISHIIAQSDTIYIGDTGANSLNIRVTTSSNEGPEVGANLLNEIGLYPNLNAASRFLGQATFGADYELIEEVRQKGFQPWIEEQFQIPYTFSQTDYALAYTQSAYDSLYNTAIADTTSTFIPLPEEPKLNYWYSGWMHHIMESPDLLRSRVAFALSEIFVVSDQNVTLRDNPLALASFYDMLSTHTFGNFRDLLEAVTLHPAMGVYLSHLNNPKSDPSTNTFPDENFAREIMQLFTIGLVKLNLDGTPQLDEQGNEIPTYENIDIFELAKVFTGLSYGDADMFNAAISNQNSFIPAMQMFDDWHEAGEKQLIEGYTIPNRNPVDGLADLNEALDHLFNHPNVGPFISRQLIQRLITSNPSPQYIARVSAVFNDNGQGVRGDMKALIRAILLDAEARDCALISHPTMGKLREPLLRYTHFMRAFNAVTPSGEYRNSFIDFYSGTKQRPLSSASVFNFFRPDYSPNGLIEEADKVAPEFQILDANTAIEYATLVHRWVFERWYLEYFNLVSGEHTPSQKVDFYAVPDFSDELEFLLADEAEIEQLVERLNLILVHGNLSEVTRNAILEALRLFPTPNYRHQKLSLAIYLIMTSPDYLIFR